MKKFVLVILTILCCAFISVSHAEGTGGANFTWSFVYDTLYIEGTGDMAEWYSGDAPWKSEKDSIQEVSISEGCTSIASSAFSGCAKLQTVTIPEGVTAIGDGAFSLCSELTSITLPASLERIGEYVFTSCDALESIDVAAGNPNFTSVDGVLFSADMTRLYCFPCGKPTLAYAIPEGVTTVGSYAFCGSKYLEHVTFPEGLTTIEEAAFQHADLISLTFPSTLVTIEKSAFWANRSITRIVIPANVRTIGEGAFCWCDKLMKVTVQRKDTDIYKWEVFAECSDNLVILGLDGSTAQAYAIRNGIAFQVIPGPWTCPACSTNLTGGNFCWECGTAKPEEPRILTCTGCGYVMPENIEMKFCPDCGTKFEQ